MSRLPVIVGLGGVSPAGRTSFHHAYRRLVIENLSPALRRETLVGLAAMMKLVSYCSESGTYVDGEQQPLSEAEIEARFAEQVLASTLVRRIEPSYYNADQSDWQQSMTLKADTDSVISFVTRRKQLPQPLPAAWQVEELDDGNVRVVISESLEVKVHAQRDMTVKGAGQLPSGFEPGEHYNSRFHPRGLQMAVVAASDAVRSVGIDWDVIANAVQPDEVGVYASSLMSQMDDNGWGGMLQSRLKGKRVSTKQCPLGMNTMPADFINAYVLGSVGATGSITGACASFLYNLRLGLEEIQSGRRRVVVVGNSEAPITPEIMDGYAAMSALASDDNLRKLDGLSPDQEPDYRRSSRPFGENCGFTMAESAQYFVLMDDALAMELGADIHGAVTDVFVNADGFKKSISAPGPGNYVTMAQAVASARAILGEESVRERSFVQAHGSSTPQNRITESKIFDRVAEAFGINDWPISAVKAYVGHSLAPASADQLFSTLGAFKYGLIPGIKTIDKPADNIYAQRLQVSTSDIDKGSDNIDVAFINSKGFGGNNATATVLAPHCVESMLCKRYGEQAFAEYCQRREQTRLQAADYDRQALQGDLNTIYHFGEGMIDEDLLELDDKHIKIPGFAKVVDLDLPNHYQDMV